MTAIPKGGSEAREGGHVDCAVRLQRGGDRMLHIAKEASARGTQVTGLRGVADLGYGLSVGVYERAAEDDARDAAAPDS